MFIIAAPNFLVKPLLNAVTAALTLIFNQGEHYDFKTQYYSGVKILRPVQNAAKATNKINSREKIQ